MTDEELLKSFGCGFSCAIRRWSCRGPSIRICESSKAFFGYLNTKLGFETSAL
jgi:hypothetical protein